MVIALKGNNFGGKELDIILDLLNLLSNEEQDQLALFLESPYFNKDNEQAHLYQRILTGLRKGSEPEKEYRISALPLLKAMHWEKFSERKIRSDLKSLLNKLPQLIMTFMEHHEVTTNRRIGGRAATLAWKKKKNTPLFWEAAHQLEDTIHADPISVMRCQDAWWLYHQLYFHQYAPQYHETARQYLAKAVEQSLLFHQLTALRYYSEVLNRSTIVGEEPVFARLKDEIEGFIEEDSPIAVVALYSMLVRLLDSKEQSDIYYQQLKTYFEEHFEELAAVDRLIIIKNIFNRWVKHYENGSENAPAELLHWAKIGVESEVFLFEGSLSDQEFLNLVMALGIAGEFSFLEQFIEKFKPYLEEKYREKAYQMALITAKYLQGDLAESLERLDTHFAKWKHIDLIYMIRVKIIYVLIYLRCCVHDELGLASQLECEEEFVSRLEALRKYTDRVDVLDEQRKLPYGHFAFLSQKIYNYHLGNPDQHTPANKTEIVTQIKEMKPLVARYALLTIAKQLRPQ